MNLQKSDSELWEGLKKGCHDDFAEIYRQNISGLIKYGYRVTTDHQLIKDSIHDLFLYLWQRRGSISHTDSVKFYLFRSLRNRIQQHKNSDRFLLSDHIDFEKMEHLLSSPSAEDVLVGREWDIENIAKLKSAIENLPARQQEIIQLRYFHNFGPEEIARIMGITNQSVRNLIHRTIHQLRRVFELTGKLLLLIWAV